VFRISEHNGVCLMYRVGGALAQRMTRRCKLSRVVGVGRVTDAERTYREDLSLWKGNLWGLLGLTKCFEKMARPPHDATQVARQFADASKWASGSFVQFFQIVSLWCSILTSWFFTSSSFFSFASRISLRGAGPAHCSATLTPVYSWWCECECECRCGCW
jgi:hypothetical protein